MSDHRGVQPVRGLILVVGLAACAWFALGIRQAIDTDKANTIVYSAKPSAAQLRHAGSLLHDAKLLNPDLTVDLLRAELVLRQGQNARSRQIALSVAHREPLNIQAWTAYARASFGDVVPVLIALEHLRELDPLVFRKA